MVNVRPKNTSQAAKAKNAASLVIRRSIIKSSINASIFWQLKQDDTRDDQAIQFQILERLITAEPALHVMLAHWRNSLVFYPRSDATKHRLHRDEQNHCVMLKR